MQKLLYIKYKHLSKINNNNTISNIQSIFGIYICSNIHSRNKKVTQHFKMKAN